MKKTIILTFLVVVIQCTFATSPIWDSEENKKDWTKLMIATYNEDITEIEKMIKNGVDLEEELKGISEIDTAIYIAIKSNKEKSFDVLVENGADLNHRLIGKSTYLYEAVINNRVNLVKKIISKTDLVNEATIGNMTPLIAAASDVADFEIFEMLVKAGANINAANIAGYTALHDAVYFGNDKKVELLLKNGANKDIRDKKERLPEYCNIIKENDTILKKESRKRIQELLK